jgi:hypothetical protein
MPTALKVDWGKGLALFLKEIPYPDIARELGCNPSTLRCYGHRHDWSGIAKRARESLQQRDPQRSLTSFKQRAEDWLLETAEIVETRLKYLKSIAPKDLSMKQLKELTEVQKMTNEIARETFGLEAKTATQINIGIIEGGFAHGRNAPVSASHAEDQGEIVDKA